MHSYSVKKSALISYITIALNIIAGFLYTPWLIKQLGSSDYAIYTLATSIMTYFVIDFGVGATLMRFIARYRVNNEQENINKLLGVTTKLYLIFDFIVLAALTVFYLLLEEVYINLTDAELMRLRNVFLITGTMTIFSVPFMPSNGVYTAYGRIYNAKLFTLAHKIITVALVCIALLFGLGLYSVVLINASVTIAINLIKYYYLCRKEAIQISLHHKDRQLIKAILSFSIWVTVAMIADKLFFTIEPTLLGIFSNSMQITIFGIGASVEGYVLTFADALNGIFLPHVTQMVVRNTEREKITDLMIRVGRVQIILVSVFVVGFISLGYEFVCLWVGKEFINAYIVIVILLIPCMIHLTQGIASEMIFATNNVRFRALVYVIGSLLNVVLTALLAPRFGAIGAACGIGAGLFVSHAVIMNIIYLRRLKLNIRRFFKECHIRMLPALILGLAWGFALQYLFPVDSMLWMICKGTVWIAGYLGIVYALFVNRREKKQMKQTLGRALPFFSRA